MPKHNIYQRPGPDGQDSSRRLELHWQRDTFVSLATTAWAGDLAQVDTAQEFLPSVDDGVMVPAWRGDFIPLERDQVNHLIRQLRAARDQAYGKDE